MPLLSKKNFLKPKSAPSSQANDKKPNLKKFKNPLLTKRNINEILMKDNNLIVHENKNVCKLYSQKEQADTIPSNVSERDQKQNTTKQITLRKTTSSISVVSMHLSFESNSTQSSDVASEVSSRLNEPKIKEAYLKFVEKLSQSSNKEFSRTSSPLTQKTPEKRALTPLEKPLEKLSLVEHQMETSNIQSEKRKKSETARKSSNKTLRVEDNSKCSQEIVSQDSEISLSQEVLNRPDVKAAYVNFMKSHITDDSEGVLKRMQTQKVPSKAFKVKKGQKGKKAAVKDNREPSNNKLSVEKDSEQSQELLSQDSKTSLSQEVLNRPDVKAAYVKFMKSHITDNTEGVLKRTQKEKGSSKEALKVKKDKKGKKPAVKDNLKSSNKKFGVEDRKWSQELLSQDSKTTLSQEVLNRPDVKAAYVKFMKSQITDDTEGVLKRIQKEKGSSRALKAKKDQKRKKPGAKDEVNCKNHNKETTSNDKRKELQGDRKRKRSVEKDKVSRKGKNKETPSSDVEDAYKDLPLREKMALIQESRDVGLYAVCDICDKARYLPHVKDPLDLPKKWYCAMNPDDKHNKCSDPEEVEEDRDYLIDNLYNAGSLVWARMDGYPWWPAMVEDDPDYESYFWLEGNSMAPTWYHVTFFDSEEVTRAWIKPPGLKPLKINIDDPRFLPSRKNKYKSRIFASLKQASEALKLPLIDRLKKYSFINRFEGPLRKNKIAKLVKSKRMPKNKVVPEDNVITSRKTVSPKEESVSSVQMLCKNEDDGKNSINELLPAGSNEAVNDDISGILNDCNWTGENLCLDLFV